MRLAFVNHEIPQEDVTVEIVSTTLAHIRELNANLREADRKEIEVYGMSAKKGVWLSYKTGLGNKTGLINGRVAACWGCGGAYLGRVGRPWLLSTDQVYKISPLKFARIYQKEVRKMLKLFPVLVNWVADDYEEAKRLLQIVGFTLGEPEQLGAGGWYRKFSMEA